MAMLQNPSDHLPRTPTIEYATPPPTQVITKDTISHHDEPPHLDRGAENLLKL
jgi:hypothetical protein